MISKGNLLKPRGERPGDAAQRIRNHRWTHFYAELKQLGQGALFASEFFQDGTYPIPLLLFTSDVPVILRAHVRYPAWTIDVVGGDPGGGAVTLSGGQHYNETIWLAGSAAPLPIFSSILPATGVDYGEQIRGITTTNGVVVHGYQAQISPVDRGLQDDTPVDLLFTAHVTCIARGAVIDGPGASASDQSYEGLGTTGGVAGAAFADRNAVILRENDYTAAMEAAGNVLIDSNGIVANIVGLHRVPPAPLN